MSSRPYTSFAIFFACVAGVLSACGPSISYARFTQLNAFPEGTTRPNSQVVIYATQDPPMPYLEIGFIEPVMKRKAPEGVENDEIALIRAEAEARGCEAVVLQAFTSQSTVTTANTVTTSLPNAYNSMPSTRTQVNTYTTPWISTRGVCVVFESSPSP